MSHKKLSHDEVGSDSSVEKRSGREDLLLEVADEDSCPDGLLLEVVGTDSSCAKKRCLEVVLHEVSVVDCVVSAQSLASAPWAFSPFWASGRPLSSRSS